MASSATNDNQLDRLGPLREKMRKKFDKGQTIPVNIRDLERTALVAKPLETQTPVFENGITSTSATSLKNMTPSDTAKPTTEWKKEDVRYPFALPTPAPNPFLCTVPTSDDFRGECIKQMGREKGDYITEIEGAPTITAAMVAKDFTLPFFWRNPVKFLAKFDGLPLPDVANTPVPMALLQGRHRVVPVTTQQKRDAMTYGPIAALMSIWASPLTDTDLWFALKDGCPPMVGATWTPPIDMTTDAWPSLPTQSTVTDFLDCGADATFVTKAYARLNDCHLLISLPTIWEIQLLVETHYTHAAVFHYDPWLALWFLSRMKLGVQWTPYLLCDALIRGFNFTPETVRRLLAVILYHPGQSHDRISLPAACKWIAAVALNEADDTPADKPLQLKRGCLPGYHKVHIKPTDMRAFQVAAKTARYKTRIAERMRWDIVGQCDIVKPAIPSMLMPLLFNPHYRFHPARTAISPTFEMGRKHGRNGPLDWDVGVPGEWGDDKLGKTTQTAAEPGQESPPVGGGSHPGTPPAEGGRDAREGASAPRASSFEPQAQLNALAWFDAYVSSGLFGTDGDTRANRDLLWHAACMLMDLVRAGQAGHPAGDINYNQVAVCMADILNALYREALGNMAYAFIPASLEGDCDYLHLLIPGRFLQFAERDTVHYDTADENWFLTQNQAAQKRHFQQAKAAKKPNQDVPTTRSATEEDAFVDLVRLQYENLVRGSSNRWAEVNSAVFHALRLTQTAMNADAGGIHELTRLNHYAQQYGWDVGKFRGMGFSYRSAPTDVQPVVNGIIRSITAQLPPVRNGDEPEGLRPLLLRNRFYNGGDEVYLVDNGRYHYVEFASRGPNPTDRTIVEDLDDQPAYAVPPDPAGPFVFGRDTYGPDAEDQNVLPKVEHNKDGIVHSDVGGQDESDEEGSTGVPARVPHPAPQPAAAALTGDDAVFDTHWCDAIEYPDLDHWKAFDWEHPNAPVDILKILPFDAQGFVYTDTLPPAGFRLEDVHLGRLYELKDAGHISFDTLHKLYPAVFDSKGGILDMRKPYGRPYIIQEGNSKRYGLGYGRHILYGEVAYEKARRTKGDKCYLLDGTNRAWYEANHASNWIDLSDHVANEDDIRWPVEIDIVSIPTSVLEALREEEQTPALVHFLKTVALLQAAFRPRNPPKKGRKPPYTVDKLKFKYTTSLYPDRLFLSSRSIRGRYQALTQAQKDNPALCLHPSLRPTDDTTDDNSDGAINSPPASEIREDSEDELQLPTVAPAKPLRRKKKSDNLQQAASETQPKKGKPTATETPKGQRTARKSAPSAFSPKLNSSAAKSSSAKSTTKTGPTPAKSTTKTGPTPAKSTTKTGPTDGSAGTPIEKTKRRSSRLAEAQEETAAPTPTRSAKKRKATEALKQAVAKKERRLA
ncbi:unnamed protein product [Cercospora beticola]|nr:unnamed protein product [Cercospora beticola]